MDSAGVAYGAPFRVLVIGGGGVFGSRLAKLLVREAQVRLTLAGRRRAPLEQVLAELESPADMVLLDRPRMPR